MAKRMVSLRFDEGLWVELGEKAGPRGRTACLEEAARTWLAEDRTPGTDPELSKTEAVPPKILAHRPIRLSPAGGGEGSGARIDPETGNPPHGAPPGPFEGVRAPKRPAQTVVVPVKKACRHRWEIVLGRARCAICQQWKHG